MALLVHCNQLPVLKRGLKIELLSKCWWPKGILELFVFESCSAKIGWKLLETSHFADQI